MKITAIISAIGAFIVGLFALLFNKEKSKRIKAEERAEQKEKEVESLKVEKEAEQEARATIQQTQAKTQEVQSKLESDIKEIKEAVASEQVKIYNSNVNKWKKVKR